MPAPHCGSVTSASSPPSLSKLPVDFLSAWACVPLVFSHDGSQYCGVFPAGLAPLGSVVPRSIRSVLRADESRLFNGQVMFQYPEVLCLCPVWMAASFWFYGCGHQTLRVGVRFVPLVVVHILQGGLGHMGMLYKLFEGCQPVSIKAVSLCAPSVMQGLAVPA